MAQMMDPTADFMSEEDIYNFFKQLWFIINDIGYQYFSLVRWVKDGDIFRIEDAQNFFKEVCPTIWKGCTRGYFEYVILSCDFELVPSGFLDFRNRNSDFVQDNFERLKNIKPKKPVQALRVFLKLSKTSSTEENSDNKISFTSGENSPSDVGDSELRNTDEGSNQQLSSPSKKDFPSEDEAIALKKADINSNNQICSTSGKISLSKSGASALRNFDSNLNQQINSTSGKTLSLDVEANEQKNTDENSGNQISSTLGKDSPSNIEVCALENAEVNSNQQLSSTCEKDLSLEAVGASEQKNTDENSGNQISSTLGKDSPLDIEACALKNAEINSNQQFSSTSGKDLSLEAVEASELKNTEENSNKLSSPPGKVPPLKTRTSALKNTYGNSYKLRILGKVSPFKIKGSALKNTDENSNPLGSPSEKVPLLNIRASVLKNSNENSNQLTSDLGKVSTLKIRATALKNTDGNSNKKFGKDLCVEVHNSDNQISSLGKDSPSDVEAYSLQYTDEKLNQHLSSASEKSSKFLVEASVLEMLQKHSVAENSNENSNCQKIFTSEKDSSFVNPRLAADCEVALRKAEKTGFQAIDVGASASDVLLKEPSVEEHHPTIIKASESDALTDKMSQEDIYSFLKELWNVINDCEFQYFSVVRWLETGKLFRIMDVAKFYKEVCPKLCEGCTFEYFEYLLLACGFHIFSPGFLDFYHKDFLEEDFEKLKQIKPNTSILTPRAFKLSRDDLKTK